MFSCPLKSDVDGDKPKLSLNKQDMKEYLVNECPKMLLQCIKCNQEYARCDFYSIEKHDCFKNLLSQIKDCKEQIEKLLVKRVDDEKENQDRKEKIKELEEKHEELKKKKDQA